MSTLKSLVSDLVAQTRLDEALDLAKARALSNHIDFDTPISVLIMEWNYVKKTAQRGTSSFQDESMKRQDIVFRLLTMAEEMEALPSATPAASPPAHRDVILFLGANPFENLVLALDKELHAISEGLVRFGKRDAFDFRAKMHVTLTDSQRMLLEAQSFQPRFVHFAGNAVVNHADYGSGVVFEDEQGQPKVIGGDVLAAIFKQFPTVECVFLNTCDSGPSALSVGKSVPYAIGMNDRVFDEVAVEFAVAFYEAIAGGNTVPFAFDFAKMRLQLGPFPQQATLPILVVNGQCSDTVYVLGDSHIDCANPRIVR